MPADRLDLSASLAGQVSVKPEEHPDERSARLRTEARQALIEDCKGVAVFVVLLLAVIAVGAIAAYEGLWDAGASPDTRRWSQTVLSALVTGGISFVVGRKIGGR
jgi:hypothetical protein